MTRRRRQRSHSPVILLAVILLTPTLSAQPDRTARGNSTSATLPESNEALLLSSRVEAAIQAGDYRLAVELIERLMNLPGGLVAAPASRTYYPVWRQAFRLLAQLPAQGAALYRELHDAEVEVRFQEAVAAADVDALCELFHHHRLSSVWGAVGVELAARLLDQGAYGDAIEVLREMGGAFGARGDGGRIAGSEPGHYARGGTPEHKAQLAVSLAGAGALRPARRLLAELESDSDLQTQPAWRERLERLERWLAELSTGGLESVGQQQRPLAPHVAMGAVWSRALLPTSRAQLTDEGPDIAQAVGVLRRLPLQQPVLAGQMLLVRLRGRLWAIDAGTLIPHWNVAERLADGVGSVFAGGGVATEVPGGVRLSSDAELLMSNHLRHVVSAGFGKAYSVEGLTLFDADFGGFGRQPFRIGRDVAQRNELVARELGSGRLVWRTGAEPAGPLFDVAFQNVPVVAGDTLVAPIRRGDELNLVVIDPTDGRLIREVSLIGPPTRFTKEGGRCLMVTDETTLYVCTGNGVVAALARDDLSWKWATVYPSTLAEHLGQLWWQPARTTPEPNIDPLMIADDLLIAAPVDSSEMFALDRFSGRERWRLSRREYPFLIGTLGGGLVVGGHVVTCLDLADPAGRPVLWKSVPLQMSGRAAIRDERVYVPTGDGVVVLDGRSGKVLADQAAVDAPGAPPVIRDRSANLLSSDDALFSVSLDRVVKYADPQRARLRYGPEAEGTGPAERTELIRAWLDALEGHYEGALKRLQSRRFDDPQLSAARDQLLEHVFLGLAQAASAEADRLGWLREALGVASSPESAARLAVEIGRVLEEDGRWAEALRHYGEMLYSAEGRYAADRADVDRRVAAWLYAAERVGVVRAGASPDLAEAWLRSMLAGGMVAAGAQGEDGCERVPPGIGLQRLRVALEAGPARDRVDRLLCVWKLSPELKIRYLPASVSAALPIEERRRLHLERWDAHVSLGLLDEARADRAVWQAEYANADCGLWSGDWSGWGLAGTEPGHPGAEDEQEWIAGIELAFRKLTHESGEPFTERIARQWKIERAELLLDSRRPLSALGLAPAGGRRTFGAGPGRHVLVVNLGPGRIELINVYKHQQPQRQTEDGLIDRGLGIGDPGLGVGGYTRAPEGRGFEWGGRRRSAWPMVVHGQLAAVPVQGGLVCVGLGPERYAGRRQWEYAVQDWGSRVPDHGLASGDCLVANEQGVFFTPRQDRVAMVGWFDGELWWQRDLPGVVIDRLYVVEGSAEQRTAGDDRLVIVSDDRRVWVTDSTFGRRLQRIETGIVTPRRIDVAGGMIVVWGPESVVGITVRSPRVVWERACAPVADTSKVETARVGLAGRPPRGTDAADAWLAYRVVGEREWRLLDLRRGEPVFETSLGVFDTVSAIVADGDRLFVAGAIGSADEEGRAAAARVIAIDLAEGVQRWSCDIPTRVAVNATQLAAHPDVIPVLVAGDDASSDASEELDWSGTPLPAICLVSKRDGRLGEPFSIRDDYRRKIEETCEMYMLATPTRMVVQVGGNLIAYGDSPLRTAP